MKKMLIDVDHIEIAQWFVSNPAFRCVQVFNSSYESIEDWIHSADPESCANTNEYLHDILDSLCMVRSVPAQSQ